MPVHRVLGHIERAELPEKGCQGEGNVLSSWGRLAGPGGGLCRVERWRPAAVCLSDAVLGAGIPLRIELSPVVSCASVGTRGVAGGGQT